MPTIRRLCISPGCASLAERGAQKCADHKRLRVQQDRRRFDEERGTAAQRGYNSRWRKARLAFLREDPICRGCGRPAEVVDHIKAHKGNTALFWDRRNWQPLCTTCHNKKTAAERAAESRGGVPLIPTATTPETEGGSQIFSPSGFGGGGLPSRGGADG